MGRDGEPLDRPQTESVRHDDKVPLRQVDLVDTSNDTGRSKGVSQTPFDNDRCHAPNGSR